MFPAADVAPNATSRRRSGRAPAAIDADAIVASGLSAGGYLALRLGLAKRPPAAILSWYGYGTLDSDWYRSPSAAHAEPMGEIDRTEAFASVDGGVVIDGHQRPDAWKCYLYARQVGDWARLAVGVGPSERGRLRRQSPTYHVTEHYPPTFLVHGTADADVPHAESVALAAMLSLHGIDHELVSLEGLDHGLDPRGDAASEAALAAAEHRAFEFTATHAGVGSRPTAAQIAPK